MASTDSVIQARGNPIATDTFNPQQSPLPNTQIAQPSETTPGAKVPGSERPPDPYVKEAKFSPDSNAQTPTDMQGKGPDARTLREEQDKYDTKEHLDSLTKDILDGGFKKGPNGQKALEELGQALWDNGGGEKGIQSMQNYLNKEAHDKYGGSVEISRQGHIFDQGMYHADFKRPGQPTQSIPFSLHTPEVRPPDRNEPVRRV
jgi:hypothetical protein